MAFVTPSIVISTTPRQSLTSPRYSRRYPRTRTRPSLCAAPATSTPPIPKNEPSIPETYLLSLGISKEDTNRILSRHPTLATPQLPAQADTALAYLKDELNLNPQQASRALRNAPQIVFKPQSTFKARLDFLETVARISPKQLPLTISKCPHILWMNLRIAAAVIESFVEACPLIQPSQLGSVFSRVPQALLSTPDTIRKNINVIRRAGVSDSAALGRVFTKAPLALVFHKSSLEKRLRYLSEDLSFSPATVGKVLVSTPELFEWSVEKILKPRIALLESIVGDGAVAGVVDKVPSIFAEADILDRILWLRDSVGLSDEEIRSVIREAPAILTYSVVGNLAPKWTFIRDTMGGTHSDIVAAPREALCANLQQRAMPRYAFLASSGTKDASVLDILRGPDAEFCRNVAKCDPEVFRAYVDNDTYLLFFSQLI